MNKSLVLLALALVASPEAGATAIAVSAGQTVLFSFDFTKGSHYELPPYPDMRIETGVVLGSFDPGEDSCRYTFFGDVNGGSQGSSVGSCVIDVFESADEESGWLDGLLSIALTVISGEILVDPRAVAFSAIGVSGSAITPRIVPTVRFVAEPPSMWLAALALSLFCAHRLRRHPRVRVLAAADN
jgi:hypothetical protein